MSIELTILEADLSSKRKDLFSSQDTVQVAVSHKPIQSHQQPEYVSPGAGKI